MERLDSLNTYSHEECSTRMPDDSTSYMIAIENQTEPNNENFEENRLQVVDYENIEKDLQGDAVTNNSLFQEPNQNEKLFSLVIDGSDHSEFAYNLLTKEFLAGEKFLLTYVYDPEQEEFLNFRNRKETILNKYSTYLSTQVKSENYKLDLIVKKKTENLLDLIVENSKKLKADFLFFGYNGLKGPRGDNKILAKNIEVLITKCPFPTVIIKEQKLRMDNKSKGFKWLFVFDRLSTECYKIFEKFSNLLNPQVDYVELLTLLPSFIYVDDYKRKYLTDIESLNFPNEKVFYGCETYDKSYSDYVIEKVNFAEKPFYDFVVFYNNSTSSPEKKREAINLITKLSSNICFLPRGI
jgi:hypothetical protein